MIRANMKEAEISGNAAEILTETTNILRMVYEHMVEDFGEKQANFILAEMGKIAVNGFDIVKELSETLEDRIKEELKDEV